MKLRSSLRACVALTAAGAATLALHATPAQAASRTVEDTRKDVWTGSSDTTSWGELVASDRQVNVDLAKVAFRHTRAAVLVKAKYVDLRKNSDIFGLNVTLRTNAGLKRQTFVVAAPGARKGTSQLYKNNGEQVQCKGLAGAVDYTANTATVRIPRGCLGKPRWVQFKAWSFAMDGDDNIFVDNALGSGAKPSDWTRRVRVG